jgi:hypothetical protein
MGYHHWQGSSYKIQNSQMDVYNVLNLIGLTISFLLRSADVIPQRNLFSSTFCLFSNKMATRRPSYASARNHGRVKSRRLRHRSIVNLNCVTVSANHQKAVSWFWCCDRNFGKLKTADAFEGQTKTRRSSPILTTHKVRGAHILSQLYTRTLFIPTATLLFMCKPTARTTTLERDTSCVC